MFPERQIQKTSNSLSKGEAGEVLVLKSNLGNGMIGVLTKLVLDFPLPFDAISVLLWFPNRESDTPFILLSEIFVQKKIHIWIHSNCGSIQKLKSAKIPAGEGERRPWTSTTSWGRLIIDHSWGRQVSCLQWCNTIVGVPYPMMKGGIHGERTLRWVESDDGEGECGRSQGEVLNKINTHS